MRYVALAAVITAANPAMAAPAGEAGCFCQHRLEPGMTVHTTIDNPWGAEALDAGSCGMVVCSEEAGNAVLVLWFNWYNGDPNAGAWCGCGGSDTSPGKGWWVCCDDIKPGCPPARGACCIQGDCVWATRQICTARGGLYLGDHVSCEDVCQCGQGWNHEDIDDDGDVDFDDFLRVIRGWGQAHENRPDEDLDGDCQVGIDDLLRIFEHWGPPPPRGACCVDAACLITSEAQCRAQEGLWWGEASECDEVSCLEAPELGDALCNCNGDFRVGDRVTLLRALHAPGLHIGKQGTAIAAHDPAQGAYSGMITVLWDEWIEERPEVRAEAHRNGLWAIHCGWHAFHDRWSTTRVYCQDLLRGEHAIDQSGACCIDGHWCRLATAETCTDWGGRYAGDGTSCQPAVCDGPIECACDGLFNIGDAVEMNRPLIDDHRLREGDHGHVMGARDGMMLIYFERWRRGNDRNMDTDCGFVADMADRLDYLRMALVPCDAISHR